jgi:peroxiredoxin
MSAFLKFFFLLTCLFCEKSNAQQKENIPASQLVYFKSDKGTLWNQQQLDSFIVSKSNNRYRLVARTTYVEQKEDSLIYHFKLLLDPAPTDKNNQPIVGAPLPDFSFKDINGNAISLQKLKGKPIVINFWFTACVPCIEEMPALNELKEKFKNSDVVFLSMTFESKKQVMDFLKKHKFYFTAIPNAIDYCNNITEIYPLTLFINREGIVQSARHNMLSLYNYEITKKIDQLDTSEFETEIKAIQKLQE